MSLELKRFLLNSYAAFPLQGDEHGTVEYVFKIHDASNRDDPQHACRINVKVTGFDRFVLELTNVPGSEGIEQLVSAYGGEVLGGRTGCDIRLSLDTKDSETVLELGQLLRDSVERSRGRADENYMLMCRRAADSLDRFAGLISQYERQTQGMEKTRPDGLFA